MADFAPFYAKKSTSPEGTGIDHRVTDLVLFISVRASVRALLLGLDYFVLMHL